MVNWQTDMPKLTARYGVQELLEPLRLTFQEGRAVDLRPGDPFKSREWDGDKRTWSVGPGWAEGLSSSCSRQKERHISAAQQDAFLAFR